MPHVALSTFPAGKRGRERAGDWLFGRPTLSARQSSIAHRGEAICVGWLCGRRAGIFQTVLGLAGPRRFRKHAIAMAIEASSQLYTIAVATSVYKAFTPITFLVVAGRKRTRTVRHHITRLKGPDSSSWPGRGRDRKDWGPPDSASYDKCPAHALHQNVYPRVPASQ